MGNPILHLPWWSNRLGGEKPPQGTGMLSRGRLMSCKKEMEMDLLTSSGIYIAFRMEIGTPPGVEWVLPLGLSWPPIAAFLAGAQPGSLAQGALLPAGTGSGWTSQRRGGSGCCRQKPPRKEEKMQQRQRGAASGET